MVWVSLGGGFEHTPRHRSVVWPKDSRDSAVQPGQPLLDLLERRPELNDMLMPKIRAVLTEGV